MILVQTSNMRYICRPLLTVLICLVSLMSFAQMPKGYRGRPFDDARFMSGPQVIPGRVELAFYDLGGEGIAYHDSDAINHGSGELNREKLHERPGIPDHILHFREQEGVDISFTKDFADFNHPNKVDPKVNQLYIGWEVDGEWTNYTVDVKAPGRYRIITVYGYKDNHSSLWLNGVKATDLLLPEDTGNWHYWTQATVGEIIIPKAGLNLLTLHYNKGSNLAYLDFLLVEEKK